jgi:hypothetical protein
MQAKTRCSGVRSILALLVSVKVPLYPCSRIGSRIRFEARHECSEKEGWSRGSD